MTGHSEDGVHTYDVRGKAFCITCNEVLVDPGPLLNAFLVMSFLEVFVSRSGAAPLELSPSALVLAVFCCPVLRGLTGNT